MDSAQKDGGRLVVLDGMRGVAAFVVVLHHALAAWPGPFDAGYLAVDFFFILSGYVMAAAYDDRFRAGLSFGSFWRARLRRLLPTMWVGALLAAIAAVKVDHAGLVVGPELMAALLFIPTAFKADAIFPLNGVQWSLLFELIANALHASILWRLRTRFIGAIAGVSLIVMAIGCWTHGSLDTGYTLPTLYLGLARVGFGYSAGLLLYEWRDRLTLPSLPAILPLSSFVLLVAAISATDGWWAEIFGVLLMPVLIMLGARAITRAKGLCRYLGRVSYPVYAIHLPILVFVGWMPFGWRIFALVTLTLAASTAVDLALGQSRKRKRGSSGFVPGFFLQAVNR